MKATLKNIRSPDIDLEQYFPANEANFGFMLEISIGLGKSEGGDIFQLMVGTPEWLKGKNEQSKIIWLKPMLLVFRYDLQRIRAVIKDQIDLIEGDDWTTIARKLNRFFHWEGMRTTGRNPG